ncbi:MAG: pectate lyase, partial [Bacilli bacterium]|nr:pectate lyase [Bacilli bacterium]
WYRCYNWSGGMFRDGDDGIREPGGNICQSASKKNTTMPVRFLGKMYELTGKEQYKEAVLTAGDYIYNHLYPENKYYGGTCDNPNAVDKEAGVFAMYAYDTLYTLTKDKKWIDCLRQATAFTMSAVLVTSFPIRPNSSDLKAAYPLKYGYTDGSSFIVCGGTGVDNYIAYIYYELFRIYIITGEEIYLKQAEFIQQNTKSIMDWDGKLGYPYRSLVAEASTIFSFGFSSAVDDEGIMGVWLPWSSVANAEPISKMIVEFGAADVMNFKDIPLDELRTRLDQIGVGGKAHRIFLNTVAREID